MGPRSFVAGAALAAGALVAIVAACNDPEQYVYSAEPYDTANLCLGPYQAVDIVSGGTGQSTCMPTCLVNGTNVYVSTVCPPFPDPTQWDVSGQNPACPGALSAFAQKVVCGGDAGAPPDAAGVDAGDASSADAGATDDAAGPPDASADAGGE